MYITNFQIYLILRLKIKLNGNHNNIKSKKTCKEKSKHVKKEKNMFNFKRTKGLLLGQIVI